MGCEPKVVRSWARDPLLLGAHAPDPIRAAMLCGLHSARSKMGAEKFQARVNTYVTEHKGASLEHLLEQAVLNALGDQVPSALMVTRVPKPVPAVDLVRPKGGAIRAVLKGAANGLRRVKADLVLDGIVGFLVRTGHPSAGTLSKEVEALWAKMSEADQGAVMDAFARLFETAK